MAKPATIHTPPSWTLDRRRSLLREVPLFAGLSEETVASVAQRLMPRSYLRGEMIFARGMPADAFNLLAEGKVKIVRETEEGRQVILRLIEPKQMFGVSGGWGEMLYPASAYALEDSVVLRLAAWEFNRLLSTHPDLAMSVIRDLGRRLRQAEERILELQTVGVECRLARALLRMLEDSPDGVTINLSRQDLADLTGTTLSTTSRILSSWHRRGIVLAGRERVRVVDLDELEGIALRPSQ